MIERESRVGNGPGTVSVIIPTFGRHKKLVQSVLSAATELSEGDEIIVVDDASEPAIELSTLPERLPVRLRLAVIRNARNGGPATARNNGVEASNGEWIAFLDSDDLWLAGKLAAQRRLLAADTSPLVAVACGWQETVGDAIVRRRLPRPSSSRSDFFAGVWFCPGSTLLIRRDAFAICGPFADGLRRLEDFEWFLRFAKAGGHLAIADLIGASIARGGNARPGPVEEAAKLILSRHAEGKNVNSAERGDLLAYLDLERAAAYGNTSHPLRAAAALTRSILRRPRLRVPLRNWWRS